MAYIDKKKNKNNFKDKTSLKLTISTITSLIYYTLTSNELITISNLMNLKRFIELIDIDKAYDSEKELPTIQMLRLLDELLELNIEYDVDDLDELKQVILDKTDENYIPRATIDMVFDYIESNGDYDEKRILYWNKFVENRLNNIAISSYIPNLKDIIEMYENPDPKTDEKMIPMAKETLIDLNRLFNRNVMYTEGKMNSFNIADRSGAKKIIRESLENIYNPGNRITTGYKLLDKMIGGGLQGARCYLLLGVAKSFKSGTMLNIAMNVVTRYYDYQLKDSSKTPAVLYLTMENSMIETFERIYNYLGLSFDFKYTLETNKNGKKIKKYHISDSDVDDILDTIERETIERTGIALRIEFRTHMSVDTGILDKLYEDYALIDNQEIIFVVQDYIKRIHSQRSYRTEQKRDELGEVINEFCNFSKTRNIPVLTASQMNRDALKVVESAKSNKKKDVAKKLGGSQIGESSLLYENADYTIITYREYDKEKNQYFQSFKCIMARGDSGIDYFAQPYEKDPVYHNFRISIDIDIPETLGVDRLSDINNDDVPSFQNSPQNLKSLRKTITLNEIIDNEKNPEDQAMEFLDD